MEKTGPAGAAEGPALGAPRAQLAALGALIAAVSGAIMWGYTVDDALIGVAYARHWAAGAGWRFDPQGPVTDGVTPLPWPVILAPLARGDALAVLLRAKALGLVAYASALAVLGGASARARAPLPLKVAALLSVGLSIPAAANAVSGMETGVVIGLATLAAAASARPRVAAALAGACAAMRPEMAPWALTLAAGFGLAQGRSALRAAALAGVALVPFGAVVAVRLAVFGKPAPLAVLAKPSDLSHGLAYAGAALVVTLTPLLAFAPRALVRERGPALAIALAATLHLAAVALVGGDWMPYARLVAPIVPSLALAYVRSAPFASPWSAWTRAGLALAVGAAFALSGAAAAGRGVMADRTRLIAEARPRLAGATRVAALDVGWVSAATDAPIVDLAGLTDPAIAALPGGHTSKRVDAALLLSRDPDVLLLYAERGVGEGGISRWREIPYGRAVEARLARSDVVASHFEPEVFLGLGGRGAGYVLLRRVR